MTRRASGFTTHAHYEKTPWRGHLPITSEVLLSILERAVRGGPDSSFDEHILYTACEFWAAIFARTVVKHLGSKAVDNLRSAGIAFSVIGALRVASTLNAALGELTNAPTKSRRRACLRALEDELPKTKDAVDQLIADFAKNLKEGYGSHSESLRSPQSAGERLSPNNVHVLETALLEPVRERRQPASVRPWGADSEAGHLHPARYRRAFNPHVGLGLIAGD